MNTKCETLIARHPDCSDTIKQTYANFKASVTVHAPIVSINGPIVRDRLLEPLFQRMAECLFGKAGDLDVKEVEAVNARLGVHVESETQSQLVKLVNAMHVCRRCLQANQSEENARNVSSRMRFLRSWDEPGVEILTCNTCGNVWKR